MAVNSFIQGSQLFTYSGSNCIRNDYFHNECRACVDICPKDAFEIVRNRLGFVEERCIECAGCIGACPTEALQIKSFDPNAFALVRLEADVLTCKKNTPCLGVFDRHHLITMALEGPLALDLSHCSGCSLNGEGMLERSIKEQVDAAQRFLSRCGVEAPITINYAKQENLENSRRMLFRAAIEKVKEGATEESVMDMSLTRSHQKTTSSHEPLKHLHLKAAIKKHIVRFQTTTLVADDGLFFNKQITFESCTNCGDCVQFCPTDALRATPDKHGIIFGSGACIGCGICDHICKVDAISTLPEYDLVEAVFDRSRELVHYEMVKCQECRCPYPYRGGEPICDRCLDFQKNFGSMFTLARDV